TVPCLREVEINRLAMRIHRAEQVHPFAGDPESGRRRRAFTEHAGLRPPLKLHVRFSRMQLSRRVPSGWARPKVKCEQTNKPHLAIQTGLRQVFPATTAPALASMRPDATHDPSIEPGEELSNVSPLVVV